MSSTHKTPFLNLNQWLGTDKPKREDFCNDNLKTDTAIKNHVENSAAHLSASDRITLTNSAFEMGSYVGDLEEARTIVLGYAPRLVMVFTLGRAPMEYKRAPDTTNVYFAIYSAIGGSQGISATATGFTVLNTPATVVGGATNALNQMNKTYIYLAWK
ncbi:MAG: hypothetical protein RR115_07220 [Hydrogenoanaerobacterium sp.]